MLLAAGHRVAIVGTAGISPPAAVHVVVPFDIVDRVDPVWARPADEHGDASVGFDALGRPPGVVDDVSTLPAAQLVVAGLPSKSS